MNEGGLQSSAMRPAALWTVGVVLLLLTTVACNDSPSQVSQDPATTSPAPSSSSPTASAFPQERAQAAAEASLLQLDDFPAGWSTSKPEDTGDEATKFQQPLARCLDLPVDMFTSGAAESARAETLDFNSPDNNQRISESVTITTSERATNLTNALAGSKAADCLGATLDEYMHYQFENDDDPDIRQADLGTVSAGAVSFPRYGDVLSLCERQFRSASAGLTSPCTPISSS